MRNQPWSSPRPSRALALVAAALAVLAGCAERETGVLDFSLTRDVVSATGPFRLRIPVSDLDTYFQITRLTASGVWVGSNPAGARAVDAKTLLRFNVALPAGAVVLSDTLRLTCDAGGDYENTAAQSVAVERVTDGAWYEDLTSGWPFEAHEPLSAPAGMVIERCRADSAFGDTVVEVALPPDLVAGWAADAATNHGLALVPTAIGGFKRLAVASTAFTVRFVVGADTSTTVLPLSAHTTLYSLDADIASRGAGAEPVALVGGPHDFRGVVRFDLSALPAEASIHELLLELRLDPGATLAPAGHEALDLDLHQLVDIPGEVLDARPAVSFLTVPVTSTSVTVADSAVTVDVSRFGRGVERGILLKSLGVFPELAQFGFITREGAAGEGPSLEIVYTVPAQSRL